VGQKAAIALEWSEQIELSADPQKNKGRGKGVQSPSLTLSAGSGSCRDMATLMLEALRSLGFPARFAATWNAAPLRLAARRRPERRIVNIMQPKKEHIRVRGEWRES
jgi:hypothetical protein